MSGRELLLWTAELHPTWVHLRNDIECPSGVFHQGLGEDGVSIHSQQPFTDGGLPLEMALHPLYFGAVLLTGRGILPQVGESPQDEKQRFGSTGSGWAAFLNLWH